MALTQVSSEGIKDAQVKTADILDANITTAKVADNAITGAKVADNLDIPDNNKIRFGTGNDLEIYHDGSNTYLDNHTGTLSLRGDGERIFIKPVDGEESIIAKPNNNVELYYDNVKKFETFANGVTVTGNTYTTGAFLVDDSSDSGTNDSICFGDGKDLKIYHNGSHSYIDNSTGTLHIRDDSVVHFASTTNEDLAKFACDSSCELYYDNSKKFETVSGGVQVTGNLGIGVTPNRELHVKGLDAIVRLESTVATGRNVLEFYDNTGAKGYIGYPSTSNDHFTVGNSDNTDMWFSTNDTERLRITNGGVVRIPDNGKFTAGASDDLQILHDGSNSYIQEDGTGQLILRSWAPEIQAGYSPSSSRSTGDIAFKALPDGATELYYDAAKKLNTESWGVRVGGDIHLADAKYILMGDGNEFSIRHGSNDVNYITAATNCPIVFSTNNTERCRLTSSGDLNFENDSSKIALGTGQDLQIYHNGANSRIVNTHASQFSIGSDITAFTNAAVSEDLAKFTANGAVELYYDNSKKFETRSGGTWTAGTLEVQNTASAGDAVVTLNAGEGGAALVEFWADEGDDNTDKFRILVTDSDAFKIQNKGSGSWESNLHCDPNAGVKLYYDNSLKIYTEGEGASVCGDGSDCHLRLRDSSYNVRGILHATASPDIGFIKTDGSAWLYRVEHDGDYQHYGSSVSDRDRKDNITTISGTSLDKVTKLVPKTFTWKQDYSGKVPTHKVFTGFIAQEVKEHLPDIVKGTDGQNNMSVDYNGILAHAVKAIQELSAEVETLKTKVAALEAG